MQTQWFFKNMNLTFFVLMLTLLSLILNNQNLFYRYQYCKTKYAASDCLIFKIKQEILALPARDTTILWSATPNRND